MKNISTTTAATAEKKRTSVKFISLALTLSIMLSATLVSCSSKTLRPAKVSTAVGIGRYSESNTTDGESTGISGNADNAQNESGETEPDNIIINQSKKPAERDDSGLSDLSGLDALYGIPFDDQPDDWFFGQTERDPATGVVTYGWDRSESTLSILKKYGAIYRGDESRKVCYITFDSGYEYGTTSAILDALKEKNVSATFFVNGHYVESAPQMVRRMIDEGHTIANHADNHYDLTTVDTQTFISELENLETKFYMSFPEADPIIYFRPPSGSCNEWVLDLANRMGYTTVLWSWAYYDYNTDDQPDFETTLNRVMKGLHNGCVFLFHTESQTNADMMAEMIDRIRDAGFEILPLSTIDTSN